MQLRSADEGSTVFYKVRCVPPFLGYDRLVGKLAQA